MNAILNAPFIQITIPILVGFLAVGAWQNRRLDDIIACLARIEGKLSPLTRTGR